MHLEPINNQKEGKYRCSDCGFILKNRIDFDSHICCWAFGDRDLEERKSRITGYKRDGYIIQ